jgi:hypothetical protein
MARSDKRKKTTRSRKNKNRKIRGGSCGCSSTGAPFLMGGGGFTNTLLSFPHNNYYPLNPYNNDPNYQVVDSRLTGSIQTGGKRTPHRKASRKTTAKRRSCSVRRVKGGGFMSAGVSALNNAVSATVTGANDFGNGNFFQSQPSMYSNINPPPLA